MPSVPRLAALAVGILATTGAWADTLYWGGASGADWNTTSAWFTDAELTSGAGALPAASDDVIFPALSDSSAVNTVAVSEAVSVNSVEVKGNYRFNGAGSISQTAAYLVVSDGTLYIGSPTVYTGSVNLTTNSGIVRYDANGEITVPELKVKDRNCYMYVDSGSVTITTSAIMFYNVASGATLTLKSNISSVRNVNHVTFQGSGTLVADGATFSGNAGGAWASLLSSFSGTLVVKNGGRIQTPTNNNQGGATGTGKFVFAGGTLLRGNGSFGDGNIRNTSFEIVAGTENYIKTIASFNLNRATVVAGDDELDTGTAYTILTVDSTVTRSGAPTLAPDLAAAGWNIRVSENSEDSTVEYILENVSTLKWNGATGTDWTATGAWLLGSAAADFSSHAVVLFPEHDGETAKEVVVSTTVDPGQVTISGKYKFSGSGAIDIASVGLESTADVTLAADVYSGVVDMGEGATLRINADGEEVSIGEISAGSTANYTYVEAGTAVFTDTIGAHHVNVAEGATAVLQGHFGLASKGDQTYYWTGAGNLTIDGGTLDMDWGVTYCSAISSFSGTVTLKNGATVKFPGHNINSSVLGSGKLVLAGSSITHGDYNAVLSNSSIEIVAGTANTFQNVSSISLANVTITGDPEDLEEGTAYTVLSNTREFSNTDSLTVAANLANAGWVARVDTTDSGYAVVLYTAITTDGVSAEYATEEEAAAAAENYTVVLTSAQKTQGLDAGYYKTAVVAGATEGTFVVTAVLDKAKVAPTVAADEDEGAMEVTTSSVSLNVTNTKKGLYYGIAAGDSTELGVANAGTLTLCTSDNQDLDLTAEMPTSGVKYYKVIVSDEPKSND
jgi:hypothetical protein